MFISQETAINNQLQQIGWSLDDISKYSPEEQGDRYSIVIGGEIAGTGPNDIAKSNQEGTFDLPTNILFNSIATIPTVVQDSAGETLICFNTLYNVNIVDDGKKPKREGKKRGEYRLDPTNSYVPARRYGDFFINQLTVKASDLSASTWELLMTFMRGIKHSIIYHLANIDPATFHRIRTARPQKETLLRLGVILQLNLEDMTKLLESAGFTFSPADQRDAIIKNCFKNNALSPTDINCTLHSEGLKVMEFGDFNRLNPR